MQNPYQLIKHSIADGIASGQWQVGDVLPSEHALCRQFSVSRMTVNRAMRELAREKLIRRVPGKGSFVAEPIAQSALVEIRNIADEISARGGVHRASVLKLEATTAPANIADALLGERAYHSVILHFENDLPLQLEDRFVAPGTAPGYLDQDFTQITPNEFLMRVAPLAEVEHTVQAIAAPGEIASLLDLDDGAPCLVVYRRTWSAGQPVSAAMLYHPGARFRLSGRFEQGKEAVLF
jgi:GntR family histidine utilization transcriptional repressor